MRSSSSSSRSAASPATRAARPASSAGFPARTGGRPSPSARTRRRSMARADASEAGDVLDRVAATIAARRGADPATSYVAAVLAKGDDAILKKIGEEATE